MTECEWQTGLRINFAGLFFHKRNLSVHYAAFFSDVINDSIAVV